MAKSTTIRRRSERLNLRTTEHQKRLFEVVASRQGVTVTDFILESAQRRAEELLVEQRQFSLPAEDWGRFVEALDRPACAKDRLQTLFEEPTVLERDR